MSWVTWTSPSTSLSLFPLVSSMSVRGANNQMCLVRSAGGSQRQWVNHGVPPASQRAILSFGCKGPSLGPPGEFLLPAKHDRRYIRDTCPSLTLLLARNCWELLKVFLRRLNKPPGPPSPVRKSPHCGARGSQKHSSKPVVSSPSADKMLGTQYQSGPPEPVSGLCPN